MTDISVTIFRETVDIKVILGPRGLQDGDTWVPRLVWCHVELFCALLWCWQPDPNLSDTNLHQLLIYIGAASGEIKHVNMVTNHTLLPTGLGRILMGWKLHLQLNFMRLHLEIEQSYQTGKMIHFFCLYLSCFQDIILCWKIH